MEKISPRIDVAFKKFFGTESNKNLLMSLINSIVGEEDQVVDITLLNPYNQKNFEEGKLSSLDIKAKGACGKKFNIEIHIADEADYDKKALYCWARLYTEKLKVSENHSKLEKVIGIHILNFIAILGSKKYHHSFHITEKEMELPYFKCLKLYAIELKKFIEKVDDDLGELVDQLKSPLDMWLAFLTRYESLSSDNLPQNLHQPALKKALKVLKVMNFTDEEREVYEGQLKWLRIKFSAVKKAEERGYERGLKEGLEEGRKERRKKEKLSLVKKLLQEGMPLKEVAEMTTLSLEEIQALENQKV